MGVFFFLPLLCYVHITFVSVSEGAGGMTRVWRVEV